MTQHTYKPRTLSRKQNDNELKINITFQRGWGGGAKHFPTSIY